MRDRYTVFEELKSYTERLAREEQMLASSGVIMKTPEERAQTIELLCDTLAVLLPQKARLVVNIHKENNNVLNPNTPWVGECPKCGKKIVGRNMTRYCKYCGQPVEWE